MKKSSKAQEPSRFQWTVNHYIGLVLILILFVGINFVGEKRYFRQNVSGSNYTKLTDLSKNLIGSLDQSVELINYVSPQDDPTASLILNDVEKLLDEYAYHSEQKVLVKRIDPYVDFEEARKVAETYKVALQENVIIVKSGERHKVLSYRDLAKFNFGGPYSQTPPGVESFNAEQAITSAIQSLVLEEASKVYFLTGHGEYAIDSTDQEKLGLSVLVSYLERQNIEVASLNLIEEGRIPTDADLIVVAGPKAPLTSQEIEMLRGFVLPDDEATGRLILLLDANTDTGLEDFLADRGVVFRDDLAVTRVMIMGQVRLLAETIAAQASPHPALDWMGDNPINLGLGACRSIEIEAKEGETAQAKPVALLQTPESYWGETGSDRRKAAFDEGVDHQGPLTVAALIDSGTVADGTVKLQGDRIAAFGSAEFLTNQLLQGNQLDLFINLTNWMLDREESLGITPKVPEEFSVTLDDQQRQILSLIMIIIVPGLGLIGGLLIWLRRRK